MDHLLHQGEGARGWRGAGRVVSGGTAQLLPSWAGTGKAPVCLPPGRPHELVAGCGSHLALVRRVQLVAWVRALVGIRMPPHLSDSELSMKEAYRAKEEPQGHPAACWQSLQLPMSTDSVGAGRRQKPLWLDTVSAWAGDVHKAKSGQ